MVVGVVSIVVAAAVSQVFGCSICKLQVRSKEMHQKAEFGHAAHWSYKESHSMASSLGWISGEKDTEISVPHTLKV